MTIKDSFSTLGIHAIPLTYLFGLLLGAILTAGYYAVINHAITAESVQWKVFWPGVRRYTMRLVLYYLLLLLIFIPTFIALVISTIDRLATINYYFYTWIVPLFFLTFAIAPIAIMIGQTRFITAVARSVAMMWGRLPTSLLLVLQTIAVYFLVLLPFQFISEARSATLLHPFSPVDSLRQIPMIALQKILMAVIGVWAVLMLFFWYRDTYPAPVESTPEPPSDNEVNITPAEA